MSDWFHVDTQQKTHGPVSGEILAGLFQSGQVTADTLVWRDGLQEWQALRSVASELGLVLPPQLPQYPRPPVPSGQQASPQWNDPGGSRLHPQPPHAGLHGDDFAPSSAGLANRPQNLYAGFWKRTLAFMLDSLIMAPVSIPLGLLSDSYPPILLLSILGAWIYAACFESSGKQATPGKMALGIKVVNLNGQRLSFGQASGRHFGKIISGLILYIGFMMAGWSERKQALHDMMAGTLVVNKNTLDQNSHP